MGYRGSKSVLTYTVKEQRVDGSYFNQPKLMKLWESILLFPAIVFSEGRQTRKDRFTSDHGITENHRICSL